MRESAIERADRDFVKARGGLLLKFVSPGRRGVPDDLLLLPVAPEHRATVALYFRFVEYKAPGEEPEPHQLREHERLRQLGYRVDVIDGKNQLVVP